MSRADRLITCTRCQARIEFDVDRSGHLVEYVKPCVCPPELARPVEVPLPSDRYCAEGCGRKVNRHRAVRCPKCAGARNRMLTRDAQRQKRRVA